MTQKTTSKKPKVAFGVRLPTSGPLAATDAVIRAADLIEALGFDSVWTNDHVSWTKERLTHFSAGSIEAVEAAPDQDPNFFESLTTLSFIAGRTRRVRLIVSALVIPLHDPRLLARQALTIDALSGGRLTFAIGLGNVPNDFEVMNVPWERRGKVGNEYLAALEAAFGPSELSEYHGEFVSFSGAGFFPKPKGLQRWIAGNSPAAFRRVVRFGNGWLETARGVEHYAQSHQALLKALAAAGRPESSITCATQVTIALANSYEEAVRIAGRSVEHRLGRREGRGSGLEIAALGTPEQAAEKLQEYVGVGAQHFGLKIVAHSIDHYLEMAQRIAEEVVPLVK